MKKIFFAAVLLFCCFLRPCSAPASAARVVEAETPQKSIRILGAIRRAIVRESLRHVGKPYRWAANGPSSYDCSGFVKAVYGEFGIHLPRRSIEQGLSGFGIPVDLRYLRMGDVIYFHMKGNRYPHHIGIYIGKGLFVHASSGKGVDIDRLEGRWREGAQSATRLVLVRPSERNERR